MAEYIPNGLLIKQIHNRIEKQANNALRAEDLTMMQISVLMALQKNENHQLSMKELEHYFSVAQSTVAGIVSRLEQKGFVEALGDNTDKRIKLVHITPDGEICCKEAAYKMDEAEETMFKGFSPEEETMLNQLLRRIVNNLG